MTKKAKLKKDYIYLDNEESIDTVIHKDTELNYVKNYYEFKNYGVKIRVPESLVRNNLEYFEIIKEHDRNWKPEYGEAYWFEEIDGNICYDTYTENSEDNYIIQQHPVFPTKEEAGEWQKAKNTLYGLRDQINGDWVPDWENHKEAKYMLIYNYVRNEVDVDTARTIIINNDLWFKENPRTYCRENGISWDKFAEAFKIYIREI
jgi:hypothetical protein